MPAAEPLQGSPRAEVADFAEGAGAGAGSGAVHADWLKPFRPRRGLHNAHLQTIAGNFMRRQGAMPALSEELVVPVEPAHLYSDRERPDPQHPDGWPVPETAVMCLCHWQPEAHTRLTVVLVHGLEGSASSGYVLGNTARLWADGCNVVRMNMRSCGGTDALAPTIYHSGRSEDVAAVVEALHARGFTRIALIGYSMGGNLVVRYAGQQSVLPPEQRCPALCAVAGVSPLLDLAPSSRALHLPGNRLYERRFLRAMKRRLRAKATLFPGLYQRLAREGVYARIRTMRDFDGEIVARFGGFADADDYYTQTSASQYASRLAIPTVILHAADDPFIRTLPETSRALQANRWVRYVETSHGGHCAFLGDPLAGDQGRWAEETLARWLATEVGA
ncbi:YheT family hydrolase [Acidipila sp. EB88]|uniref:YheT family hydrolase n=1 Tax=Acidipila sp. EB88 TaxID=2305226 RepID=UPI000F5E1A74|nr:alpha/beta fold hydrolase [Acidipila sp. EB88]RRA47889.1 alpha/beta fold hydrolase [Acidipila sp. EB88]